MGKPSFADVIAAMEKVNVTQTVFEPGVCVPGLDLIESPITDIIAKMEKV